MSDSRRGTTDVRSSAKAWKKCSLVFGGAVSMAMPLVVGAMTAQPLLAQQPATKAAFDVTSVKPSLGDSDGRIGMMMQGANGAWKSNNVTAGTLIRLAYQLQGDQLVGGPKWLFEDRFDVTGTGTAPGRDGSQFDKVKSLLTDRFKLVTHMETREQPVYALVLARRDGTLGMKMTPSSTDCSPTGPNGRGRGPAPLLAPGERPKCGLLFGPGRLFASGQTVSSLASDLSRFVGRMVVDRTGLTGTYDVELEFAPNPGINVGGRDMPHAPAGDAPATNSDGPSIFAALQEQLGLKLESTRGPVNVLVIDGAKKPTQD